MEEQIKKRLDEMVAEFTQIEEKIALLLTAREQVRGGIAELQKLLPDNNGNDSNEEGSD